MAVRKCPQCFAVVSAARTLAYSHDLECPGCRAPLEVSAGSRTLATLAGLLASVLVWRLAGAPASGHGELGWVLPVVYAFFAFSIVAPLTLMFVADLRLRPAEPTAEPEHAPIESGQAEVGHGQHRAGSHH